MKRIIKEPLVHFLLIGAALFAAFSFVSDREAPQENAIVVSAGRIEHLAALFARTWQRPPSPAELQGLIDEFLREEAAYRAGMAVGLDRDDTIIRRRVRQKLEFIAEDIASRIEPGDEDLATYLAAHPDDYRVDPRLTFRQVYLNPEERGDHLEADARELLVTLNGDRTLDAAAAGDRTLLEHGYADVSLRDVANLFGPSFAAATAELVPGTWQGPIESGYGFHLVLVDDRTEGRVPELDEVRDAVRRDWDHARREEATEKFYRDLLDRHEIVIEWPETGAQEAGP